MNRIRSIDGWRAIAALGVLWTHAWATTGFKSIMIGKVDLFKAINIVGNGVHLFFIISGFCMYLIFRKIPDINIAAFLHFIKKRWIRIAPSFYFACIVIGIYNSFFTHETFLLRIAYNFLFLQNIFPDSVISAPFWSLAVEWHFYILLPALFLSLKYFSFSKGIFFVSFLALLLNVAHYVNLIMPGINWWYFLPGNVIHFCWGILLCYVIKSGIRLPSWLGKTISLIPAFVLASIGKALFSKFALDKAGNLEWLVLSVGPPVMTAGFTWLIYISLVNNFVGKMIGNKMFTWLGKISYSFYLWHEFILQRVFSQLKGFLHYEGLDTVLLFIITLCVLVPFSYLSYYIFERFYFAESKKFNNVLEGMNS